MIIQRVDFNINCFAYFSKDASNVIKAIGGYRWKHIGCKHIWFGEQMPDHFVSKEGILYDGHLQDAPEGMMTHNELQDLTQATFPETIFDGDYDPGSTRICVQWNAHMYQCNDGF